MHFTECFYHVMYVFQRESTLYSSDIASVLSKEFLDIQATVEYGFTLKHVRDMIRTYILSCMVSQLICYKTLLHLLAFLADLYFSLSVVPRMRLFTVTVLSYLILRLQSIYHPCYNLWTKLYLLKQTQALSYKNKMFLLINNLTGDKPDIVCSVIR